MKIVKFNNKQIFPSLINEFFNDDFGVNFLNRNHSVPSVNTIENDDSFEIDLAVPGMKKDDFSIRLRMLFHRSEQGPFQFPPPLE